MALTCEDDAANAEQDLTFIGRASFYADSVPQGARHDFALADIVLDLQGEITSGPGPYEEGNMIDYGYTLTNNSNAGADGVVSPVVVLVEDDKVGVTCDSIISSGNLDENLDPGESVSCHADPAYVVTADDALAGSVITGATAWMGSTSSTPPPVVLEAEIIIAVP